MSPSNPDPYTSKAAADRSPADKIADLKTIIGQSKFAMLTTRSPNGSLHSRAMSPGSTQGLVFEFIGNRDSGKFDELEANDQVNISWSDGASTNWASASGKATLVNDRETIKDLWNPTIKAWFGDLGDGKHTGDIEDPRVGVIRVVPDEIRLWVKRESSIRQAFEVAKGAVTGETASPGDLLIISASDLELARSIDSKKI